MVKTVVLPTSTDFRRPAAGGTESYVRGLVKHLPRKGVDVRVAGVGAAAAPRKDDGHVTHLAIAGRAQSEARFTLRLVLGRRKALQRLPDESVVLGNAEHYCLPFVAPRKLCPVVLVAHGAVGPTMRQRKSALYSSLYERFVERPVARRADRIVAVNTEAYAYYRQKYPARRDRIRHIPVPVDTILFAPRAQREARERWDLDPAARIVLYVGRLAPEKRVHLVVGAFRRLAASEEDLLLLVAGDGPDRSRLEALASQSVSGRVRFLGNRPRPEIPALMNAADVLVLTSRREAMPTVVLEGLACGVPVVSTEVGDVPRFLDEGRTGYVVEANEEAISEGIKKGVSLRGTCTADCVGTAKRYSWDALIGDIVEVCDEAAQED